LSKQTIRNKNQNHPKECLSGQKLRIDDSKSLQLSPPRQFIDGYVSFPDRFEISSFSHYLIININLEWLCHNIQHKPCHAKWAPNRCWCLLFIRTPKQVSWCVHSQNHRWTRWSRLLSSVWVFKKHKVQGLNEIRSVCWKSKYDDGIFIKYSEYSIRYMQKCRIHQQYRRLIHMRWSVTDWGYIRNKYRGNGLKKEKNKFSST
jgi:hypothetical protein